MISNRAVLALAATLFAGLAAATACAAPGPALDPAVTRKIDSRLLSQSFAAPAEMVPVWVTFADKGGAGPADLERRLAAAERALSPRARARRLKAGVSPLVDELDLPVSPDYLAQLRAAGLEPQAVSRWFNRARVRVPAADLQRIARFGFVSRLSPVERAFVTHDPDLSATEPLDAARRSLARGIAPGERATTSLDYGNSLDEMQQLDMVAVHDSGYIGQGVLICMLDEGFYSQNLHEATSVINTPPGYRRDFVDGDSVVTDVPSYENHGLQTLSCVGAYKPGFLIGTGFGATFALARTEVHSSETPVEMTNWAMCAEWADSLGADIISSSLGYFTFDSPYPSYTYADMNGHTTDVTRAAEIAAAKGILVVNSAGNEGNSAWHYIIAPADANGDSVISAGGVQSDGVLSGFSSRGPTSDGRIKPDLCARGTAASVAYWTGPTVYAVSSGTSFSCPLIAGVCACIMSARPDWRPQVVIQALRLSASRATMPDSNYGYGIVDALAALRLPASVLSAPAAAAPAFGIALLGPNPLRAGSGHARVRFAAGADAAAGATATVSVVDVGGRSLRTLWSGALVRGSAIETTWDGRDRDGRRVLPGVYWIALQRGARAASVRLVAL